jgi:DNA-binding NarL/FixJ family response regulator
MIRVLLVDDDALVRSGLRIMLAGAANLDVVAEAADGREVLGAVDLHRPDVVLMDIRMPGADGLTATAAICADPGLSTTRVLILTTFETDEDVARSLRAGASGFLGKDVTADELLSGIRTVAAGDALLSPRATHTLVARFLASPAPSAQPAFPGQLAALTAREREVTALAAEGKSNDEIAQELVVSPLTIRTHVHRAMAKLHARDRAQLVVIAYQCGLVQVSRPPE